MKSERPLPSIDLLTAPTDVLLDRMQQGVRLALAEHKRAGRSIIVWDEATQKTIELPPDQIPDFDDDVEASTAELAAEPAVPPIASPSLSSR